MTITEFLETRIAEDEAHIRKHDYLDDCQECGFGQSGLFDTARIFRECEAKRRFVRDCAPFPVAEGADLKTVFNQQGASIVYGQGMRLMAAIYSDHPDYQQEWAL